MVPTLRELGIGIMAYSPLGRGLLAGRFSSPGDLGEKDFRRWGQPRFAGEAFEANQRLAAQVAALADKKGCTPAQLALAWLLAQGEDVIPIPGGPLWGQGLSACACVQTLSLACPAHAVLTLLPACPPGRCCAGTKSAARLEENVAAVAVQLSPAELAEVEAAVPADAVVGSRY